MYLKYLIPIINIHFKKINLYKLYSIPFVIIFYLNIIFNVQFTKTSFVVISISFHCILLRNI